MRLTVTLSVLGQKIFCNHRQGVENRVKKLFGLDVVLGEKRVRRVPIPISGRYLAMPDIGDWAEPLRINKE